MRRAAVAVLLFVSGLLAAGCSLLKSDSENEWQYPKPGNDDATVQPRRNDTAAAGNEPTTAGD